jgi:adenine-specific DNA-methyltransferase
MYAKNFNSVSFNLQEYKRIYKHEKDGKYFNLEKPLKTNAGTYKRETMLFGIKTKEGKFYPPAGKRWTIGEETAKSYVSKNKYKIIDGEFYIMKFSKDYKKGEYKLHNNLLLEHGSLKSAKDELQKLSFDREIFDSPKPEILLKRIVEMSTKENDIVLDFFAGSGTTGAVAHKMNRQYILIEQMDYIKDLLETRIKKVIEGEQGGISKAVNWKGGGEFIYMEMREFNQEFLNQVNDAKSKAKLKKIFKAMKEKAFLSYRFSEKEFTEKIDEFDSLSLEDQKLVLDELLDKNQMYLPHTEIRDITYKVSKEDIEINKSFYKSN